MARRRILEMGDKEISEIMIELDNGSAQNPDKKVSSIESTHNKAREILRIESIDGGATTTIGMKYGGLWNGVYVPFKSTVSIVDAYGTLGTDKKLSPANVTIGAESDVAGALNQKELTLTVKLPTTAKKDEVYKTGVKVTDEETGVSNAIDFTIKIAEDGPDVIPEGLTLELSVTPLTISSGGGTATATATLKKDGVAWGDNEDLVNGITLSSDGPNGLTIGAATNGNTGERKFILTIVSHLETSARSWTLTAGIASASMTSNNVTLRQNGATYNFTLTLTRTDSGNVSNDGGYAYFELQLKSGTTVQTGSVVQLLRLNQTNTTSGATIEEGSGPNNDRHYLKVKFDKNETTSNKSFTFQGSYEHTYAGTITSNSITVTQDKMLEDSYTLEIQNMADGTRPENAIGGENNVSLSIPKDGGYRYFAIIPKNRGTFVNDLYSDSFSINHIEGDTFITQIIHFEEHRGSSGSWYSVGVNIPSTTSSRREVFNIKWSISNNVVYTGQVTIQQEAEVSSPYQYMLHPNATLTYDYNEHVSQIFPFCIKNVERDFVVTGYDSIIRDMTGVRFIEGEEYSANFRPITYTIENGYVGFNLDILENTSESPRTIKFIFESASPLAVIDGQEIKSAQVTITQAARPAYKYEFALHESAPLTYDSTVTSISLPVCIRDINTKVVYSGSDRETIFYNSDVKIAPGGDWLHFSYLSNGGAPANYTFIFMTLQKYVSGSSQRMAEATMFTNSLLNGGSIKPLTYTITQNPPAAVPDYSLEIYEVDNKPCSIGAKDSESYFYLIPKYKGDVVKTLTKNDFVMRFESNVFNSSILELDRIVLTLDETKYEAILKCKSDPIRNTRNDTLKLSWGTNVLYEECVGTVRLIQSPNYKLETDWNHNDDIYENIYTQELTFNITPKFGNIIVEDTDLSQFSFVKVSGNAPYGDGPDDLIVEGLYRKTNGVWSAYLALKPNKETVERTLTFKAIWEFDYGSEHFVVESDLMTVTQKAATIESDYTLEIRGLQSQDSNAALTTSTTPVINIDYKGAGAMFAIIPKYKGTIVNNLTPAGNQFNINLIEGVNISNRATLYDGVTFKTTHYSVTASMGSNNTTEERRMKFNLTWADHPDANCIGDVTIVQSPMAEKRLEIEAIGGTEVPGDGGVKRFRTILYEGDEPCTISTYLNQITIEEHETWKIEGVTITKQSTSVDTGTIIWSVTFPKNTGGGTNERFCARITSLDLTSKYLAYTQKNRYQLTIEESPTGDVMPEGQTKEVLLKLIMNGSDLTNTMVTDKMTFVKTDNLDGCTFARDYTNNVPGYYHKYKLTFAQNKTGYQKRFSFDADWSYNDDSVPTQERTFYQDSLPAYRLECIPTRTTFPSEGATASFYLVFYNGNTVVDISRQISSLDVGVAVVSGSLGIPATDLITRSGNGAMFYWNIKPNDTIYEKSGVYRGAILYNGQTYYSESFTLSQDPKDEYSITISFTDGTPNGGRPVTNDGNKQLKITVNAVKNGVRQNITADGQGVSIKVYADDTTDSVGGAYITSTANEYSIGYSSNPNYTERTYSIQAIYNGAYSNILTFKQEPKTYTASIQLRTETNGTSLTLEGNIISFDLFAKLTIEGTVQGDVETMSKVIIQETTSLGAVAGAYTNNTATSQRKRSFVLPKNTGTTQKLYQFRAFFISPYGHTIESNTLPVIHKPYSETIVYNLTIQDSNGSTNPSATIAWNTTMFDIRVIPLTDNRFTNPITDSDFDVTVMSNDVSIGGRDSGLVNVNNSYYRLTIGMSPNNLYDDREIKVVLTWKGTVSNTLTFKQAKKVGNFSISLSGNNTSMTNAGGECLFTATLTDGGSKVTDSTMLSRISFQQTDTTTGAVMNIGDVNTTNGTRTMKAKIDANSLNSVKMYSFNSFLEYSTPAVSNTVTITVAKATSYNLILTPAEGSSKKSVNPEGEVVTMNVSVLVDNVQTSDTTALNAISLRLVNTSGGASIGSKSNKGSYVSYNVTFSKNTTGFVSYELEASCTYKGYSLKANYSLTQELFDEGEKKYEEGLSSSKAKEGDILFAHEYKEDGAVKYEKVLIDSDSWTAAKFPKEFWTPIGIVVIPGSHDIYGTYECGVVGLKESKQAYLSDNVSNMSYLTDIKVGIANYSVDTATQDVMVTDDFDENTGIFPFPSDYNSPLGRFCPHDNVASYKSYNTSGGRKLLLYIPSPYNNGAKNTSMYFTQPAKNALADISGLERTKKHKGVGGIFRAFSDYETLATTKGEWFFAAAGETGYLIRNTKKVNTVCAKINSTYKTAGSNIYDQVYSEEGNSYITSTPQDNQQAMWSLSSDVVELGWICSNVRPFIRVLIETEKEPKYTGGVSPSNAEVGDVVFDHKYYENDVEKYETVIIANATYRTKNWNPNYWDIIGVVVVPGSHNRYGDRSCGVAAAYTSDYFGALNFKSNVTTSLNKFCYFKNGVSTDSPTPIDYVSVAIDEISNSGTNVQQHPNDNYRYYIKNDNGYLASPFINKTSANSNFVKSGDFVSTFNGSEASKNYMNYANSGSAFHICNEFKTKSTKNGDWYLPSFAEIYYMYCNTKTLKSLVGYMIEPKLSNGAGYLTSTVNSDKNCLTIECSEYMTLGFSTGHIVPFMKLK